LVTSGALIRRRAVAAERAPTLGTRQLRCVAAYPASDARPDARHVLAAAALLGRRFDWDLLPGVATVDGATVVRSLRRAVDAQRVDGQRFRVPPRLTREAGSPSCCHRSGPSCRATLVAVERAHPGLPGPWCEVAAELAERRRPGDGRSDRERRRALARGALASAELTADRARSWPRPVRRPPPRPRKC
jgi:hypothetical protein